MQQRQWRSPPAAACRRKLGAGYASIRSPGDGMPTSASACWCHLPGAICTDVSMGANRLDDLRVDARHRFNVIIGSWKIIAMSRPRASPLLLGEPNQRAMARISPATTRPGASTSPMIEKPVTDLPDPDSPTNPSTSPAPTARSTPSTARTSPALLVNQVCWPRTSKQRCGHFASLGFSTSGS